jgi:hypothetical protein
VRHKLNYIFSVFLVPTVDEVGEHAPHVRKEHVKFVICLVSLLNPNELRAFRNVHLNPDFVTKPFHIALAFYLHKLKCIFFVCFFINNLVYFTVCALADQLFNIIQFF